MQGSVIDRLARFVAHPDNGGRRRSVVVDYRRAPKAECAPGDWIISRRGVQREFEFLTPRMKRLDGGRKPGAVDAAEEPADIGELNLFRGRQADKGRKPGGRLFTTRNQIPA